MEKHKLSDERKREVVMYLDRAISALLDAEMAMLIDAPIVYNSNDIAVRIEYASAYRFAEKAENFAIDCLRDLQK